MKKYYYLDGSEKKGPFTEEEFINLNLKHETLIWTEGCDNWKPLSEFPDLLKIIPPPLPENFQSEVGTNNKSKKVRFSFLTLFVLLIVSFIIVSILIETKKNKLKEELSDRIERVFNGKSIVCDGVNYKVFGELRISKPTKPWLLPTDPELLKYEKEKEEGIIEKFYRDGGGFTFKKLKNIDLGYELEVITSTDMAYTSNNYWRGTVQEAYNSAYDYFLEENSSFYSKGSYELIENFKFLKNDYYYLMNTKHYVSSDDGNYYNNYIKVYYKGEGWYYEIAERDRQIKNDFIKIYSIPGGISILVFILLLIFNPFKW